jgi:hypothetical protein
MVVCIFEHVPWRLPLNDSTARDQEIDAEWISANHHKNSNVPYAGPYEVDLARARSHFR